MGDRLITVLLRIRRDQPQEPDERVTDWHRRTWLAALREFGVSTDQPARPVEVVNYRGYGRQANRYIEKGDV